MSTQIIRTADGRTEKVMRQIRERTERDRQQVHQLCRNIENAFLSWVARMYREGEITEEKAHQLAGEVREIRRQFYLGRGEND